MTGDATRARRVDFDRVNAAALRNAEAVVRGLLPEGRRDGVEWVAKPPHRPSTGLGSFKVNLNKGAWGDFKTGDKGGDLVSLAAFVAQVSQRDAAIKLAGSLGMDPFQ